MVSNGSLITKKVIAYSLKDLMKTKDFQKISIKEIMEHADYRRQTFYDHFADKYELLDWIYQQEITEIIEHFISYEHWTKIISRMLHYFEKNLFFYEKALLITENNSFDSCFSDQIQQFIKSILLESNNANCSIDQLEKNTHFYAYGFTGIIKEWIFDKCQTPAKEIEDFLISVVESTIIKKDSNS